MGQLELSAAELGLVVFGSAGRHGWGAGLKLNVRVSDDVKLSWHLPAGIGASVSW